MPTIRGDLWFVSSRAAQVSEVWVRAPRVRTHLEGVVTTGNDHFPVIDGEVSFSAVPGPAVLALISQGRAVDTIPILVGDGAEQTLRQVVEAAEVADDATKREIEKLAAQVVELLDSSTENARKAQDGATRAETAAGEARQAESNATSSASAAEASAGAAATSEENAAGHASTAAQHEVAAQGYAGDAAGSAERAATIAGSTRWVGTQLEVNGELSPDLKGEASKVPGPPGPPGVVVSTTQPSDGQVWIDPSGTFDFVSLEARISAIEARLNGVPDGTLVDRWEPGGVYHRRWRVMYDGYGTVNGSLSRVYMNPAAPESLSQTHAALVVNDQVNEGDLDFVVTVKTLKQTRKNDPPNGWECAWVMWDWTAEDSFYAVALKPNGWEISKQDSTYDGNQRYIGSNTTPTFDIGVPYRIWVKRVAGETYVRWAVEDPSQPDGIPATGWNYLWHFTDEERPLNKGQIAFYVEDAEVEFTGLVIR